MLSTEGFTAANHFPFSMTTQPDAASEAATLVSKLRARPAWSSYAPRGSGALAERVTSMPDGKCTVRRHRIEIHHALLSGSSGKSSISEISSSTLSTE